MRCFQRAEKRHTLKVKVAKVNEDTGCIVDISESVAR
jgi:hypothetical protein